MLIWRVENGEGLGPYFDTEVAKDIMREKSIDLYTEHRHPSPADDGLVGRSRDHIYGFANHAQLKAWFRGAMSELGRRGFKVALYKGPDEEVIVGRKQVAFPKTFKRVREIPIMSRKRDMTKWTDAGYGRDIS